MRKSGLTQEEIEHNNAYNSVDTLFATDPPAGDDSDLTRVDYLERIVAGRFPYALDLTARSRSRWFDVYVEQLVELHAPQITKGNPRPHKIRAVLLSCATRTDQELNKQATARDVGVTNVTADTHLRLLEDLSIIVCADVAQQAALPATRFPKVHLVDPGLAAHLLDSGTFTLTHDATLVGQLLETFQREKSVARPVVTRSVAVLAGV